jgi:hypothetical protein
VFAGISAITLQFWKWNQEKFSARIDEFCKLVLEAADAGADYWTHAKPLTDPEKRVAIQLAETKIDGFQRKVDLFRVLIQPRLGLSDKDKLVELLANFFDALTGGNFGTNVRTSDPVRAKLVYVTAADLVTHLRILTPAPSIVLILGLLIALSVTLYVVLYP